AVSGLVPEVDTVITNSVSLHPVLPPFSMTKIGRLAPLVGRLLPHISPAWGDKPEGLLSRAMVAFVRATHRECDNSVCRMVSFTYGTGWPALWSHDNIDEATHDWISGEFGACPITFLAQMDRCSRAGHLVPVDNLRELPSSFVADPPQTDARFVFLTGEHNRCFLPKSQQLSFDFFAKHRPGRDTLHLIGGYGHLDVFFGRDAWKDTYPLILEELSR
ncbi:MAG: esterase, partial [Actinobacteria bacterium]|nr:esterase [Actinomycetota bacterium]